MLTITEHLYQKFSKKKLKTEKVQNKTINIRTNIYEMEKNPQ